MTAVAYIAARRSLACTAVTAGLETPLRHRFLQGKNQVGIAVVEPSRHLVVAGAFGDRPGSEAAPALFRAEASQEFDDPEVAVPRRPDDRLR